ncbi:MAG: TRL-like family protein [Proteobacteria bacterium]|nr:TRL-like family protein [Pseudomonadota bacterium]
MRFVRVISSAFLLSFVVSCASAHSPVSGFWYTNAKGGTGATSEAIGSKKGKACASSILGIIGTGDASIAAAAKQGGISKVSTADYSAFSVLGFYAESCTLVTGN